MIRRLRFSESEVRPSVARLAPVEPTELVVEVVSELFERSERTDEDVPEFEFDDEDVPLRVVDGELVVFG
jgi:hypothetical protein